MQSLPGVRSQRHIHIYELTAQVYRQIDTHTQEQLKGTLSEKRQRKNKERKEIEMKITLM